MRGDGRSLWRSEPIDRRAVGAAVDVDVDVFGVRWLELRVHCMGSQRSAHAVWIDPAVIR